MATVGATVAAMVEIAVAAGNVGALVTEDPAVDGPADGGVAEQPVMTRIRTQPARLRAPASNRAPRLLITALARRVFIAA
jgi:hypothetical protein